MSFNPRTGLVYLPVQDIPNIFALEKGWHYRPGIWNTGTDFGLVTGFPAELAGGHLSAWDPLKQREVWRADYKGPWNGGTLTTAGNLVFQGTADGRFVAYQADNGTKLWEAKAGTGVVAAPVTYEIDGEQYVSVMAGWGGAFALVGGDAAAVNQVRNVGRLLTYKLGGKVALPVVPEPPRQLMASAPAADAVVKKGEALFSTYCMVCHGAGAVGGGVLPDLRYMPPEIEAGFSTIVVHGALRTKGMPKFGEWLNENDAATLLAYLHKRADDARAVGGK